MKEKSKDIPSSSSSDSYHTADESPCSVNTSKVNDQLELRPQYQAAKQQLLDSLAKLEFHRRNVEAYDEAIADLTMKRNQQIRARILLNFLEDLSKHDKRGWFLVPVTSQIAPDYHTIIKAPMDLGTMRSKVEANDYDNLESFVADLVLVFQNCKTYNKPHTLVAHAGVDLEKHAWEIMADTEDLMPLVPADKMRIRKVPKKKSPPWTFRELPIDTELDRSSRRSSVQPDPGT